MAFLPGTNKVFKHTRPAGRIREENTAKKARAEPAVLSRSSAPLSHADTLPEITYGYHPGRASRGTGDSWIRDPTSKTPLRTLRSSVSLRSHWHCLEDRQMDMLPKVDALLVVRTDFSDQERWQAVRNTLGDIDKDGWAKEFASQVKVVEDPAYQGLTAQQILALLPDGYQDPILVIADKVTVDSQEMPFLVIELEFTWEMRVIPSEIPGIRANLSIGNMDFGEFAESADADGVFRGFHD
ncbi:DUF6924 domain-containing protein [Nonomuraea glycinis]|uniref:DUF6924 domain-containing protein n=1 Tax=Nonomuraea glycinis TaxID=2047744 RepID=UPI0033BCBD20